MQNFRALGAPPPDPRTFGILGLCPQTPIGLRWLDAPPPPNTAPQLRISGYAPAQYSSAVSHKKCVNLIEHQVKCLLECSFITLLVTVCWMNTWQNRLLTIEISKSDAGSFYSFCVSSAAKGGRGGFCPPPPPLVCRPKCRIRKIPRF